MLTSRNRPTATGMAVTILVAIAAFVALSFPESIPAISTLLPLIGLLLIRSRLRVGILSPVAIVVAVLSTVGLFGFLLSDRLEGLGGGGMQLALDVETRARTAYLFGATAAIVLAGAALILGPRKLGVRAKLGAFGLPPRAAPWFLLASLIPAVLVLEAIRAEFLVRDQYLAGVGGSNLFGFGQQVAIASVVMAGNVAASRKGLLRILAVFIAVIFGLLFLGLGSRRLALVPVAFALGIILAKPKYVKRTLIPALILAAVLLPLPLYLRGLSSHGLLPYFSSLGDYNIMTTDWAVTINNILIAFPITGETAFSSSPIPLRNLAISLNPLPGSMAGWYGISGSMTLNAWTPFSAVGEVANYGLSWMIIVWLGIGALLGWLELRMASFMTSGLSIVAIGIVGLSALFAIQMIQYTLRSSTRMLVYAIALAIVAVLFNALRRKDRLSADTISSHNGLH